MDSADKCGHNFPPKECPYERCGFREALARAEKAGADLSEAAVELAAIESNYKSKDEALREIAALCGQSHLDDTYSDATFVQVVRGRLAKYEEKRLLAKKLLYRETDEGPITILEIEPAPKASRSSSEASPSEHRRSG